MEKDAAEVPAADGQERMGRKSARLGIFRRLSRAPRGRLFQCGRSTAVAIRAAMVKPMNTV